MAPSPVQLLMIGLIILILFGASRLGEVGKGLGDGIRNFKKGLAGDGEDEEEKDAKQLKKGDEGAASAEKTESAEKVAEKKEKV